MTQPTTDPLSGLPRPSEGRKPSPLMSGASGSQGQRWWLEESPQPDHEVPEHSSDVKSEPAEGLEEPISVSTRQFTPDGDSNSSTAGSTECVEPDGLEAILSKSGGITGYILAGIAVCLALFFVF
jgi:hypothetical protein